MSEHELGGFLALGLAILPCIVIIYKHYCWNKQYDLYIKLQKELLKTMQQKIDKELEEITKMQREKYGNG